ncbi:hypothetical protein, partial [Sinorhizobium medicae]|uniref:hypothetical protein n=1 Tax=Sinorhizobium medicae TaxID=110321 RepID=UPI001AEC810D
GRLVMVSPVSGIYAKVRQKFHLSPLFKFPEPALGITRQQFNASEVVGHKPILKPVLEPFCLCRQFGRNGRQFNLPLKGP